MQTPGETHETQAAGAVSPASDFWLVFDGQCGLCRRSVALLHSLDRRRRIRFVDLHEHTEAISRRAPGLTREAMMQAMQLITRDGSIYAGYEAIRQVSRLVPALWPVLPLLYLPGMSRLGPGLYRWIARRRYGIARCSPDGSCRL